MGRSPGDPPPSYDGIQDVICNLLEGAWEIHKRQIYNDKFNYEYFKNI